MGQRDYSTLIEIGDILVSGDVVTEFFACDYEKCKGCCCVIGDSGAPLSEEELQPLEDGYPAYELLLSEAGKEAIARTGFFDIDRDGDLVTPCVPETGACAYVRMEGDKCLCAVETCHLAGECRFRKPISCSLYPIRVSELAPGRLALNLHRWSICQDAFEKGKKEKIRVYEFLRGPLTERFGEDFYSALSAAASRILARS